MKCIVGYKNGILKLYPDNIKINVFVTNSKILECGKNNTHKKYIKNLHKLNYHIKRYDSCINEILRLGSSNHDYLFYDVYRKNLQDFIKNSKGQIKKIPKYSR